MTYIVYADVILLWHVVINFLLLFTTNKLLCISKSTIKITIWSIMISILLMGTYVHTLGLSPVIQGMLYMCLYLVIYVCYIKVSDTKSITQGKLFQAICSYFLATITLAGTIEMLSVNKCDIILIPLFIIICGILPNLFKRFIKKEKLCNSLFKVTISTCNKNLETIGFLDTGNTLYDFYSNSPVIILDYRLMTGLLESKDYKTIEKYHQTGIFDYQNLSQVDKAYIYPLPYRTISSNFATMPAFKIKELRFEKENKCYKNIVAAISKNKLKNNYDYQVLLNERIKPNREEYSND